MSDQQESGERPRCLRVVLADLVKELTRGMQSCAAKGDLIAVAQHKAAWDELYQLGEDWYRASWHFLCGTIKAAPPPLICQVGKMLGRWKAEAEASEARGKEHDALWLRAIGQAVYDAVDEWAVAAGVKPVEGSPQGEGGKA